MKGKTVIVTGASTGIYYLATADFVTGELLNIDGGHVAGHRFG